MAQRASRRRVVRDEDDSDEGVRPEGINASSRPEPNSGKLKPVTRGATSTGGATRSATTSKSPNKSKIKVKSGSQEPPKAIGKPIYSFFNKATQREHHSRPSADTEVLPAHREDVEAIHDDTEDEKPSAEPPTTTLSQGSSTAWAMRKRKFTTIQSRDGDATTSARSAQKFRKVSSNEKPHSRSDESRRPWTERFAPANLSELAVHKRKVGDVREWLEVAYRGQRQKVLVLKGPAGTGKSTTARLLADDLGIELLEWRDSTSSEFTPDSKISTTEYFQDFVARAGKVRGLELSSVAGAVAKNASSGMPEDQQTKGRYQALLVEEFPNTFSKTSNTLQAFRSTLAQFIASSVQPGEAPMPMIMVISETLLSTNTATADSFTAHRLLGPELSTNPYINTIEFNPVAPTYLTKALEAIVVKEARQSGRRRTPGPLVLKHLAGTGDIRSAVSSLEFLCVRNDDKGDTWSSKIAFTKSKQARAQPPLTQAEEDALKLISNRENSLGIFHSVGKVVYNKRIEPTTSQQLPQPPSWLSREHRSKVPETNADSLLDELGTDTSTFIAALHENYALSCPSKNAEQTLGSLSDCTDNLSDSDLLSVDRFSFGTRAFSGTATDNLRQDEMSFQVAVRGLLFSLPFPVQRGDAANGRKGDAFRMFYPASLRLWRKQEEIENTVSMVAATLNKKASAANVSANDGVNGWKHGGSFKSRVEASTADNVESGTHISLELKNEMLLERLPYMAQILNASKPEFLSKELKSQITAITRLEEPVILAEMEEDELPEAEQVALDAEQWTTDRPNEESSSLRTSPRKRRQPAKPTIIFEGVTLPTQSVERLVLEDDDIED